MTSRPTVLRIAPLTRGAPELAVSASLILHLMGRGLRVAILRRGPGPARQVAASDDTERAGARLLAAFGPVWTGAAEDALIRAAASGDVLVDCGKGPLQPAATATVLVADPTDLVQSRLPWPFGPLTLRLRQIPTGAATCLIGRPGTRAKARSRWADVLPHVLETDLTPLETGMDWQEMPVLAFAGGGDRHAFFAALEGLGARVLRRVSLDGDGTLPPAMALRLSREAAERGAQLVTTERDAVRLPDSLHGQVLSVPMRAGFADVQSLDRALAPVIPDPSTPSPRGLP